MNIPVDRITEIWSQTRVNEFILCKIGKSKEIILLNNLE